MNQKGPPAICQTHIYRNISLRAKNKQQFKFYHSQALGHHSQQAAGFVENFILHLSWSQHRSCIELPQSPAPAPSRLTFETLSIVSSRSSQFFLT